MGWSRRSTVSLQQETRSRKHTKCKVLLGNWKSQMISKGNQCSHKNNQSWLPPLAPPKAANVPKTPTSSVLQWQNIHPEAWRLWIWSLVKSCQIQNKNTKMVHSVSVLGTHCGLDHPLIPECGTAVANLYLRGGIKCGAQISHHWDFSTYTLYPPLLEQIQSLGQSARLSSTWLKIETKKT